MTLLAYGIGEQQKKNDPEKVGNYEIVQDVLDPTKAFVVLNDYVTCSVPYGLLQFIINQYKRSLDHKVPFEHVAAVKALRTDTGMTLQMSDAIVRHYSGRPKKIIRHIDVQAGDSGRVSVTGWWGQEEGYSVKDFKFTPAARLKITIEEL